MAEREMIAAAVEQPRQRKGQRTLDAVGVEIKAAFSRQPRFFGRAERDGITVIRPQGRDTLEDLLLEEAANAESDVGELDLGDEQGTG